MARRSSVDAGPPRRRSMRGSSMSTASAAPRLLCGIAVEVRGRGSGRLRLDACSPTPSRSNHWPPLPRRAVAPGDRSSTPTAGTATAASPPLGYDAPPAQPGGRRPARAAPAARSTAQSPTSRPGCTAPTAASATPTCRPTSTSSSSATTAAATPMAAFQTLLGLGDRISRPTTYAEITRARSRRQPERAGIRTPRLF